MIINWPFSRTRRIRCPDGSIKIVQRNINDVFPLALKEMQAKIEAEVNADNTGLFRLNGEYAQKIGGLLYSISDQNQCLMMSFRSAYIGYQSAPCCNNGFFIRHLDKTIEGQQRLMELKMQITGLIALAERYPNNPEKVLPMYYKLVARVGGDISESIIAEIRENTETMKNWIGGQQNG